eukprot:3073560-Pyramimonas_sp.AAC.1
MRPAWGTRHGSTCAIKRRHTTTWRWWNLMFGHVTCPSGRARHEGDRPNFSPTVQGLSRGGLAIPRRSGSTRGESGCWPKTTDPL